MGKFCQAGKSRSRKNDGFDLGLRQYEPLFEVRDGELNLTGRRGRRTTTMARLPAGLSAEPLS